jgi:S-adenosylmethionine decarboxylase
MLLELRECNPALLDDLPYIKDAMRTAAGQVGAHIVGESFHQFDPQGVTGILAISESHLCIHTWPERGYAAADVFTCGTSFDPEMAAQVLIEKLESKDPSLTKHARGEVRQPVVSA